jgi:hypothetical protein
MFKIIPPILQLNFSYFDYVKSCFRCNFKLYIWPRRKTRKLKHRVEQVFRPSPNGAFIPIVFHWIHSVRSKAYVFSLCYYVIIYVIFMFIFKLLRSLCPLSLVRYFSVDHCHALTCHNLQGIHFYHPIKRINRFYALIGPVFQRRPSGRGFQHCECHQWCPDWMSKAVATSTFWPR